MLWIFSFFSIDVLRRAKETDVRTGEYMRIEGKIIVRTGTRDKITNTIMIRTRIK